MGEQKMGLWRRIIVSKYEENVWGWVPKRVPRYRSLGFWVVISSLGDESKVKGENLCQRFGIFSGGGGEYLVLV